MDEIENARIACEIAAMRIKEIESMISDQVEYKDRRQFERSLETEQSNLKYRKEILVRTALEYTIDETRSMFFKNAQALGQDAKHILQFMPKVNVQEFPTIPNLRSQVKYWQEANDKLCI